MRTRCSYSATSATAVRSAFPSEEVRLLLMMHKPLPQLESVWIPRAHHSAGLGESTRWRQCAPWSDGLFNLFGAVQEELLSQWRALPPDSRAYEHQLNGKPLLLKKIAVRRCGPRFLVRNPLEGVQIRPSRTGKRIKPTITLREFRLLVEAMDEPYATMVFVCVVGRIAGK